MRIEKNVPIPDRRHDTRWRKIAEALEVGDSVYIDNPPYNKYGQLVIASYMAYYKPKKFKSRREDKGARIWRVA